ncbi:hypothetical protein ACFE04_030926 [Oxalis oulophora]
MATLSSATTSQLCSSKNGMFSGSRAVFLVKPNQILSKKKQMKSIITCQATSIPAGDDRVPDMERRNLMNLLLLGALSLPTGIMLVPYGSFFVPPGTGGGSSGTPAKDALGNDIIVTEWLKTHGPGDRTLSQGLRGDPTYLVVEKDRTLATYGINAVCTHLGCVVPWNAAENKFMCPCHGSQYNNQGKVVRGPAPLMLEVGEASTDEHRVPTRLEGKNTAIFVCWLLGNGCLFSWNSMLTIVDYYTYLFPHYHPSRVLTLVYQPFALGTLILLTYNEAKLNTRKRNITGYCLFFVAALLVLVIDLATKGKGGLGTFIGICALSGAFGVADAHVQGGMVGDLSFMQPEFLQSFFAGLAASGALTSGLRLITKAAFENSQDGLRKGAILFFAISCFFEFLCVLLYAFVFPKLPIVKYYRSKAASEGSKTVSADLAAVGIQRGSLSHDETNPKEMERLGNKDLLFQNIDYAVNLFFIYALTLSIFPGFLSEDTGKHGLGEWYALVLVAMYNVWDLIGRYVPLLKFLKMESRKGLTIAILCRFLLVPAFYFTAKYGDQGYMIFLTSFLGLSNGYFTVCIMTSAPKGYKGPEQNALGNLLVCFLVAGIFAGVMLDWLWLIGKGW